jgi:outer membrane protein OmpA-like peptidoglycan-associated protein
MSVANNMGDLAANKTLSVDRANAIRDLLVRGGVDSSRLSTEGYGAPDKSIASHDTEGYGPRTSVRS